MQVVHPRLLTIATAAMLSLPQMSQAQASGSYTISGNRVQIYNLAGTVEIRSGSGNAVTVEVQAAGRDARDLSVETGTVRGYETLRVIYPGDRVVYDRMGRRSQANMRVDEFGTFYGQGDRDGRRVRISGSGQGVEAHANLIISIPNGRVVDVFLGVGDVSASNVNSDLTIDVGAATVVADRIRGNLNIDTGSGSITVRDITGNVNLDTGSGRIEVDNVQGDVLVVDTGSGSVRGDGIRARTVNVDTGSGSITLRSVSMTDGRLDTGSGRVHIDLLTDVNDLEIDTGSGSVTIGFTDALGADLDLESSSGSIDFDVPIQVRRVDRRSLRGTLGDGRGRIHVDTGSGSIRFVRI